MRTITAPTRAALQSPDGEYVSVTLLEIDHTSWANPVRITNNELPLFYNSATETATEWWPSETRTPSESAYPSDAPDLYAAVSFKFEPPGTTEDGSITQARITISNVDQSLTAAIRALSSPPSIKAIAVYWPNTGTTEAVASWDFILRKATGNAQNITGEIVFEDRLQNEYPAHSVTPDLFPGAFA